jgi:hypothetical protein
MKTNLDKIRAMTAEELSEIFAYKNICPYTFGGNRRGKYKTCPYPRHGFEHCQKCWIEWLGKKASR